MALGDKELKGFYQPVFGALPCRHKFATIYRCRSGHTATVSSVILPPRGLESAKYNMEILMPSWPDQRRFAFTIFDDPDSQTLEAGREVYALLKDLGFRTTKGAWPVRGPREPSDHGITCDDAGCLPWLLDLQQAGFEIGLHNVTLHTSTREETIRGIARFEQLFGHQPLTMAQHYFCKENIYWGAQRVSGRWRVLYNLLTRGKNRNTSRGHIKGDPLFWGDVCHAKVKYLRNFVFAGINTLKACPWMPYHDPQRPYVNYWYASSEGANVESFVRCLQEPNQERLEDEGGACRHR